MAQLARNVMMLVLVLGTAWLGTIVGQSFTTNTVQWVLTAYAAPDAKSTAPGSTAKNQERYQNLELFQKVLHFVEGNYVEDVKNSDLIQGAIKGMLSNLDPHSSFLPPDVFKDMKVDTSGQFGGLGIEIGVRDSVLTIISPIDETPAWRAGLKPGDRIVKIDGVSTKGLSLVEAVNKMRGKKGTRVKIGLYRSGWEKVKDVDITREIIKIRAVPKEEIIENGFGYVRLATFNENAADDVKKAIARLEKNDKLKGLVLDLRMNPGGLLDQAVEVVSLFLDEGVVVSTIGRNKDQKEVKHARKGQARKDLALAILVNSSSASAAEIVAGALQDHKRGIVMGQPTFGKGSVQTVIELGQDMGLKLTIARYYTPSGRSIQEKGVAPDILLENYDPELLDKAKVQRDALREKDLPGHMANDQGGAQEFSVAELEDLKKDGKDKEKSAKKEETDELSPNKLEPKKDYQVREAINYLKSFEIFKKISSAKPTDELHAVR